MENNLQSLLASGTFSISLIPGAKPDEKQVEARVNGTAWLLGKHLPALKAADTIYSFGLEHTRAIYYCLMLPAGKPSMRACMHA